MDSRGTNTSFRVTSGAGWAGGVSSRVGPRLGCALRRGPGCSAQKAGMGLGVTLEPDLLWRSLRVGLACCRSLEHNDKAGE